MKSKKIILMLFLITITIAYKPIYSTGITDEIASEVELENLVDKLNEYAEDLDISSMTQDVMQGKGVDYGKIGNLIIEKLLSEIRVGLKTCISIVIVIILVAIIKNLELEKGSSVSKIAGLVGFLVITSMLLKNYYNVIQLFTNAVNSLTNVIEIISPFMLSILIATGEIATSGIIGPIILFISGLIGTVVSYIIVPFLSASLVFNIITNMSDNIKLNRISSLLSSTSMWIIAVIFAAFLGALSLETSVTTSVDSVALKATQAAVSNAIPVVGKFVSDSMDVVMGASKVIGKTVGFIGIVVIIVVGIIPLIKIIVLNFIHYILASVAEAIGADSKITNLMSGISKQYQTITGVLCGIIVIFVIAVAIFMVVMGKVSS